MGCCRETSIPKNPPGSASRWGELTCDTPLLLLEHTIEWIKTNLTYDFVVYTGDTVNHHDVTQTWPKNFAAIETVTKLLQTLGKPIYNVLGNHDTWPIDQLWEDNPVVTQVATLWENDTLTNGAKVRNFTQGGYYRTLLNNTVPTCVLNSLWYDNDNLAVKFDPKKDWGNQFLWASQNLDQCFLLAHIPPRAGEASKTFNAFIETVNPVAELYGHSHDDEFVMINGTQGLRVALVAPSVVPSGHYPGVRVFSYEIDNQTIRLLDYDQYHLNLTRQQESEDFIGYDHIYRASSSYDLQDLSANSMANLAKRMTVNDTLFQTYCDHYEYPLTKCNKKALLCDIWDVLC
jgi:sphingomyelin phosphodiesterase